jgi:hypothetical protein
MALIKFRMIEYWNKEAKTHIGQTDLFAADLGNISLDIPADKIEIQGFEKLISKYAFSEVVLKFEACFTSSGYLKVDGDSRLSRQEKLERVLSVLKA